MSESGNGGKLFNGRFSKVDDVIIKIGAGVATIVLASGVLFGFDIYAFMSEGDRYTEKMHLEQQMTVMKDAWKDARREFVHADVYARDREYLKERLDNIDDKLDRLLKDK